MPEGVLKLDFSRGTAVHRLYGHAIFLIEAEKAGKDERFMKNICNGLECDGKPINWRDHLELTPITY